VDTQSGHVCLHEYVCLERPHRGHHSLSKQRENDFDLRADNSWVEGKSTSSLDIFIRSNVSLISNSLLLIDVSLVAVRLDCDLVEVDDCSTSQSKLGVTETGIEDE